MRVVVLYNQVSAAADEAERDVLVQAEAVEAALRQLGHEPIRLDCSLRLDELKDRLLTLRPEVVFNLVESLGGSDWLAHAAASLLDVLQIPYTGSRTEALMISNNKLLAKGLLRLAGLPTPDWVVLEGWASLFPPPPLPLGQREGSPPHPTSPPLGERENGFPHVVLPTASGEEQSIAPLAQEMGDSEPTPPEGVYVIKAVREHASVGLDEKAVVRADNRAQLQSTLAEAARRLGRPVFAERYIEGREFNLSLLAGPAGPEVLPPAEIDFSAFPPGKVRIVGYAAKWQEGSFEYHHTPRRFLFPPSDVPLLDRLKQLALACWRLWDVSGYARVDFRVDQAGRPWILEINANPCLAPDAGFAAAVEQAGLTYSQAIDRILQDALNRRNLMPSHEQARGLSPFSSSLPGEGGPASAGAAEGASSAIPAQAETQASLGCRFVYPHALSQERDKSEGVVSPPASSVLLLPPGYQFRDQPRLEDRQAVREIVSSTGFFNPAEIEVADELVRERLQAGPASGYYFLFLEHQGQVIGYACYGPIAATAHSFDLYWIAVHRRWQGGGLGRAILHECERRIYQAGGRRIYIETSGRTQYEPTRQFYQRCAYQCEACLKDFYAPGDDKLIYVKVLAES